MKTFDGRLWSMVLCIVVPGFGMAHWTGEVLTARYPEGIYYWVAVADTGAPIPAYPVGFLLGLILAFASALIMSIILAIASKLAHWPSGQSVRQFFVSVWIASAILAIGSIMMVQVT